MKIEYLLNVDKMADVQENYLAAKKGERYKHPDWCDCDKCTQKLEQALEDNHDDYGNKN